MIEEDSTTTTTSTTTTSNSNPNFANAPLFGLSSIEVSERQKQFGRNEIVEKKRPLYLRFLMKFVGLTPTLLVGAAVLEVFLARYVNFAIIIALLVLNAIIAFSQEKQALDALEALKQKLKINARVLRDSKWELVDAQDLVPGDVVRLRHGDFVPADIEIVQFSQMLLVDESSLTGESELKPKEDIGDVCYSGAIVKEGEATGVVIRTGMNTYFGKAVQLITSSAPKLHIEKILYQITLIIVFFVSILLVISLIVLFVESRPILSHLPLLLALIVSAVPVALPAMFTITMALGSKELSNKGVLITRLSATEDAARMNILCCDKTGTLTYNRLELVRWKVYRSIKKRKPKIVSSSSSATSSNLKTKFNQLVSSSSLEKNEKNEKKIDNNNQSNEKQSLVDFGNKSAMGNPNASLEQKKNETFASVPLLNKHSPILSLLKKDQQIFEEMDKEQNLLLLSSLTCMEENNDPIDSAILRQAEHLEDISPVFTKEKNQFEVLSFQPFHPLTRRTAVLLKRKQFLASFASKTSPSPLTRRVLGKGKLNENSPKIQREKDQGRFVVVTKGAVNTILALCQEKMNFSQRSKVEEQVEVWNERGYRVLAVAKKETNDPNLSLIFEQEKKKTLFCKKIFFSKFRVFK